jgi:hypothetical protein
MSLKRTLTAVAVDQAKDYFRERLEHLKQLDLDHDGRKDVDQLAELTMNVCDRVKEAVESTDFQKLASGLEQVIAGAGTVGASIDQDKLKVALGELGSGLTQIGKLLKLGIAEAKKETRS